MGRILVLLPVLLFFGIAGAFGWQLLRGANPQELPSAMIDRPAPAFDLPPLPGPTPGLSTADLRGGVSLVNVFASWCAPCAVEHPVLMRLARDEGIPIHGINQRDEPADALAFLRRLGNPYTRIGVDRDARASIEWGVYGVPETYVVDHEGHIRFRHVGPLTGRDVEQTILPMVRELRRRAAAAGVS